MPKEDVKKLKYNPGEKSLKAQFIVYADLDCLLEKIDTCQNNPKKPSTEKRYAYTFRLLMAYVLLI